MKNCIVYGNCHVWPIRKYLSSSSSFNKRYRLVEVPPVHMCNKATGIGDNILKNCDLFIYQKVSNSFGELLSTNYMLSRLPDHCIRISFAKSYFIPYYPQFTNSIDGYPYGDKNVIKLLQQGLSKERIISTLSDENFYTLEEVMKILTESLKDLRTRESDVDVRIVDFIEQHFRNIHLFCTINHPKHQIIRYISINILEKLGISRDEISSIVHESFINHIHPIYPSVVKHLKLSFAHKDDPCFTFASAPLTFQQYLEKYIDDHKPQGI